jgi:hypothetical protein
VHSDVQVEQQQQETVNFVDVESGPDLGDAADIGENAVDATTRAELGQFLSRPVRIVNYNWNEVDPVGPFTTASFRPWHLYFNNAVIRNKLNNFAWVRCNLHLKVIVNASPFYYGAMMMSYRPLTTFNDETAATTASNAEWVPRSQRPHVWVWPQESKGGEMVLPFFYYKNWLNIQSSADLQAMGQVSTDVVYQLNSANGATGVGVSIQVYAWASEVELSGPSIGLAVQSQVTADEYGSDGPVSAPATAIANFASTFEGRGGLIGKAATVTRIGAGAIGKIASVFGFTNVPVVDPVASFRPTPQPPLASASVGYAVEKLTLDSKNELSIDPSLLGLPMRDELDVGYLVQKDSILTTTYWDATDPVDRKLFQSAVSPWAFRVNTSANQNVVNMPPCAWVANMFANWRGDIIFGFKFVKSKYHRGRVVLYYDPSGQGANNISQVVEASSSIFTQVIDLGQQDYVELRVPYSQAFPFLNTEATFANDVWLNRGADTGPEFLYNADRHNGTICMRVLNVLTAPIATARIGLIVTMRGAENLELANPVTPGSFSPFTVQGSVTRDNVFPEGGEQLVAGNVHGSDDTQYLKNFGEQIRSLRQYLRRFNLNEIWWEPSDTTSQLRLMKHNMTRFPLNYGFDPGGLWAATGPVSGARAPFNWVFPTHLSWVMPAFVGVKGSTQWSFNVNTNSTNSHDPIGHISVTRQPHISSNATRTVTVQAAKDIPASTVPKVDTLWSVTRATQGGTSLTHSRTNTGITVQLPNYTRTLFQSTSPAKSSTTSSIDGGDMDTSCLELVASPAFAATTRGLMIDKYVAAGTDFNLFWFLNVPTTYWYTAVPLQVA